MGLKDEFNEAVDNVKDAASEASHRSAAEGEQAKRDVAGDAMTPGEKLGSAVNQAKTPCRPMSTRRSATPATIRNRDNKTSRRRASQTGRRASRERGLSCAAMLKASSRSGRASLRNVLRGLR
jgi:hypothetical protein